MSALFLDETLTGATVGGTVELRGAEAKHAASVTRLRVGERTAIGNGRGLVAEGIAESVAAELVVVRVESVREDTPARAGTILVQALAKGDRDERAVQAATELGADGIFPWAAERSVSRWVGPKQDKGRQRWATIVREAAKQSLRPTVPPVGDILTTSGIAALGVPGTRVLVLEPRAERALSAVAAELSAEENVVLVVGPEGGISPAERAALTAAGATEVRLGAEVLRTSTAGPSAIAVLHVVRGRW